MVPGIVNAEGIPCVLLTLGGKDWMALIDTGFNFGVEPPRELMCEFDNQPAGTAHWKLGAGQSASEETYLIEFPFDGQVIPTMATYANTDVILIGTMLLSQYRLTVDFPSGEVYLERAE